MFSEYRIQSNANNLISLEVSTEPLSQALKSAAAAQEVVVKLAKKNDQPVFSFEAQTEVRPTRFICCTRTKTNLRAESARQENDGYPRRSDYGHETGRYRTSQGAIMSAPRCMFDWSPSSPRLTPVCSST